VKLNNCEYDKIKLLYKFSCILWFIEKHAEIDAREIGDTQFNRFLEEIKEATENYVEQLQEMVCK
jgi:hypothetical protein